MKLQLYISNPANFIRGGIWADNCFAVLNESPGTEPKMSDVWHYCGTVEFDEKLIDHAAVLKMAEADIDNEEEKVRAEFAARMAAIEKARGELLALPGVTK